MNQHNAGFLRCVRHPSQFFTGFCPSCLVERLSNVGAVEQSSGPPCSLKSEIVEITEVASDSERKPVTEARVRRTLKLLFQLDDGDDPESKEGVGNEQGGLINSNAYQCGRSASCCISSSDRACAEITSDTRTRLSIADAANEEINYSEDEKSYGGGASSRLTSMLSKKRWRWRTRSLSKRDEMQEIEKSSRGSEDKQPQSLRNLRHSFDQKVHQDLSRGSWDPPRHSWDGSMVSKAFACSFNCLEEQQDEARRAKRSFPDEEMAGKSDHDDYVNKVNVNISSLDRGKPLSSGSLGSLFRESSINDSHSETNTSKLRRKKSHRWSKVWDWSITSPFRDFGKKHQRALGRSLSESWREGRNIKNMENVGSDYGVQSNSKLASVRPNHRNLNVGNSNLVNFRPASQSKREFKFGRSRSIHYSSPGNLDNGLLRFYLTPLRSSRRCANKGRTKNSRSLSRGIFGFY